jgi:hypothetical protein
MITATLGWRWHRKLSVIMATGGSQRRDLASVAALRPPPPGLPTLREFQAAQGAVARRWLAEFL